jgi:D-2-hydroxyacid dehydrogenase (NADP+)
MAVPCYARATPVTPLSHEECSPGPTPPEPPEIALPAILVSSRIAETYAGELARLAPGWDLAIVRGEEVEGAPLDDVEATFMSWELFPDHLGPYIRAVIQCKRLRWLHSLGAGVDNPFFKGLLERGIRLSTSSGAHAKTIAQSTIMLLLALSRDLPGWLEDQRAQRWNPRPFRELREGHLLVLGLGPIGLEIARLGDALGMRVTGVRRTPSGDEGFPVHPLSELDRVLPEADAVALALPLNDETRHVLDARRLALLPSHALVVNVGRGSLIDESALAAALESGALGGAGLDVFEVEPLPQESPLWGRRDVIVLPHCSGTVPENFERTAEIFLDNLGRYVRGEPLRNEVLTTGN